VRVAVTRVKPLYPSKAPFHPSEKYPEVDSPVLTGSDNFVYGGVREIFRLLGYDAKHYGTKDWNPLGEVIKPRDTVLVKPNLVFSRSRNIEATVTHPSVVRAVVDYALKAVGPTGKVIVADAPQYNCNWSELLDRTGLNSLIEWYGSKVEFLDLRPYWSEDFHWYSRIKPLAGDPLGEETIDLGTKSKLEELNYLDRLYGAAPWVKETREFHKKGTHKYAVSRTFLKSNVLILLPKLKTHKKVGITCCAKNLVGIVTNKNCVPHLRVDVDQYPPNIPWWSKLLSRLEMFMYEKFLGRRKWMCDLLYRVLYGVWFKDLLGLKLHPHDRGGWYGNDTLWRAIHDLLYILHNYGPRRVVCLVDAVVAGEGEGPLNPTPKPLGLLIGGSSIEAVDWVTASLVGFDPKKLRFKEPDEKVEVVGDVPNKPIKLKPPSGWVGYL